MTVRVEPALEPLVMLWPVADASSTLRMVRPLDFPVRAVPDERSPLLVVLLIAGLDVVVPRAVPWVPAVGASGLRMARGPPFVPTVDPPWTRVSPVAPPLRSMTRLPLSGSTWILVPVGRRLSDRFVSVILLVRPLSESPRRALAEMCGSLR